MRATFQKNVDFVLSELARHQSDLYRSQQVLTTGKKVLKPSDDPLSARRIMELNETLNRRAQYRDNISAHLNRLQFTESELNSGRDLLVEARAMAVQGANGTMNGEDRAALAERVDQLVYELVSIANSRHGGQFVFGGYNTREAPYRVIEDPADGELTGVRDLPSGMDGVIETTVAEGERIQVNIPGADVFQAGAPGADGDAFQVLIDLRDALLADDTETIQQSLDKIDATTGRFDRAIARIGGLVQRLTNTDERLASAEIQESERKSILEDADIAEWAKRYELQRIALDSAMRIGSDVLTTTLVQFIR